MDEIIRGSLDTKILGVTLTVCIDKGMGAIKESLRNGANIKVILIDGSTESLRSCAARSDTNSTSYFEKKHATTLDNLTYLLKYIQNTEISGKLEVRLIPYPPTVGIEVFKNNENKEVKVEIYPHHTGWDKPPIFLIDKQRDERWFSYFEDQFDAIWDRAKPYEIEEEV